MGVQSQHYTAPTYLSVAPLWLFIDPLFLDYTTQEYFQRRPEVLFKDADLQVATSCITYCGFPAFDLSGSSSEISQGDLGDLEVGT